LVGVTFTGANAANSAWQRKGGAQSPSASSQGCRSYDVDGTAVDVDGRQLKP